jgi:predicted NUDIX family phosphoesterase
MSFEKKMNQQILVCPTQKILDWSDFEGFSKDGINNFDEKLNTLWSFKRRWDMEEDPSFQQIIPYVILWNESMRKFIWYKRAATNDKAGDSRLHGKWSIWVWWHIEKSEEWFSDIVTQAAYREIEEETHIRKDQISSLKMIWFINDNSNEVWRVHIWIIYLWVVSIEELEINDGEMETINYISYEEIKEWISNWSIDFENWSKLALNHCNTIVMKKFQ